LASRRGRSRSHLRDRSTLQRKAAALNAIAGALAMTDAGGSRRPRRMTLRKLIEFDDDTFAKLKQLARDRMATFQELADEAFADLMKKHGIPIDLKDALRKSAAKSGASASVIPMKKPPAKKR
jgi:hypothetical protein